jgi:hypothetical protein
VTQETHNQDLQVSVASGHVTKVNHPQKSEVSITNIVLTIYFEDNFYFFKGEGKTNKEI